MKGKQIRTTSGLNIIHMETIKIGEACDILNGFAFKSENYVDSGIRVIRIANVQKGYIEDNTPAFYPLSTSGLDKYMLESGDLLMSLTGNVGRVALLGKEFLPAALNQRVACLRLKSNFVNKKYLFHILNSDFFEQECIRSSKGVAQKNMSTEWLKGYEIPLYSAKEQKKIVSTLDLLQSIITHRRTQLEKLDLLIKARFVEMFGDCEKNIRLGDCCEVHARIGWQALTRDEHMQTGEYMLVTGTDFINGRVNYDTCVYVAKERFDMDPHIILKENDVLITKDGSIGKVAVVHNLPKPATLNGGIFVVRPDDKFNKEYISYVFKGPLFERFVDLSKTGATIKHLNQKHLVEFTIPLPSIEKQNLFAVFSNQINKSKVAVQKALDEAQLLFDSLMQEYFG